MLSRSSTPLLPMDVYKNTQVNVLYHICNPSDWKLYFLFQSLASQKQKQKQFSFIINILYIITCVCVVPTPPFLFLGVLSPPSQCRACNRREQKIYADLYQTLAVRNRQSPIKRMIAKVDDMSAPSAPDLLLYEAAQRVDYRDTNCAFDHQNLVHQLVT